MFTIPKIICLKSFTRHTFNYFSKLRKLSSKVTAITTNVSTQSLLADKICHLFKAIVGRKVFNFLMIFLT